MKKYTSIDYFVEIEIGWIGLMFKLPKAWVGANSHEESESFWEDYLSMHPEWEHDDKETFYREVYAYLKKEKMRLRQESEN